LCTAAAAAAAATGTGQKQFKDYLLLLPPCMVFNDSKAKGAAIMNQTVCSAAAAHNDFLYCLQQLVAHVLHYSCIANAAVYSIHHWTARKLMYGFLGHNAANSHLPARGAGPVVRCCIA
jgi:hypothetical protein